jgi:hypothetical protein
MSGHPFSCKVEDGQGGLMRTPAGGDSPQYRVETESTIGIRGQDMVWRLYDTINGCWYTDELYSSRDACRAAGGHYTQEARAEGEVLALVAAPLDPTEAIASLEEEEEES